MLYKIQKGMVGIEAEKYITYSTERRTRRVNDAQINIPFARTDAYKNSYFPKTIRDWNHLQNSIIHTPSIESFKAALQA